MLRADAAEHREELIILEVSQKALETSAECTSTLPISPVPAIPTATAVAAAAVMPAAAGVPATSADTACARASRVVQMTEPLPQVSRAH